MSYRVETTPAVRAQLFTMPKAGQVAFNELMKRIAVDPWDAAAWQDDPFGNMRQAAFGDQGQGIAVFVVLERNERVVVLKILWLS